MGAKQNVGIKMCSICSTRETFINLCFAQTKLKQRNETKQARLSSLLSVFIGAAFLTSARETQIVSINQAKVISSNLSGLEHSF